MFEIVEKYSKLLKMGLFVFFFSFVCVLWFMICCFFFSSVDGRTTNKHRKRHSMDTTVTDAIANFDSAKLEV
jgi:hypothetical protein